MQSTTDSNLQWQLRIVRLLGHTLAQMINASAWQICPLERIICLFGAHCGGYFLYLLLFSKIRFQNYDMVIITLTIAHVIQTQTTRTRMKFLGGIMTYLLTSYNNLIYYSIFDQLTTHNSQYIFCSAQWVKSCFQ